MCTIVFFIIIYKPVFFLALEISQIHLTLDTFNDSTIDF